MTPREALIAAVRAGEDYGLRTHGEPALLTNDERLALVPEEARRVLLTPHNPDAHDAPDGKHCEGCWYEATHCDTCGEKYEQGCPQCDPDPYEKGRAEAYADAARIARECARRWRRKDP